MSGLRAAMPDLDSAALTALAEAHGTPLYVYSAERLRQNAAAVIGAFRARHPKVTVCFASKACALLAVLKILRAAGCALEVNSRGELEKARMAGVPDDAIVLNGVAKNAAEIAAALAPPIKAINVNSPGELARIARVAADRGVSANVSLRLVPELESGTAPGIETASSGTKFGLSLAELPEALEILRQSGAALRLVGLHVHIGSQITNIPSYRAAARFIAAQVSQVQAAAGTTLAHINLGGGFPVDYTEGRAPNRGPAYLHTTAGDGEIAEALLGPVREACGPEVEILVEPGRRLVADAAVLVSRIEDVRQRGAETWLTLDAGYHTLLEGFSYRWYFPLVPVTRAGAQDMAPFRVVGPLCDSGDSFWDVEGEATVAQLVAEHPALADHRGALEAKLVRLPSHRSLPAASAEGDLVAFLRAGAYTMDQIFAVNGRGRPAVVLREADGRSRLIRRADSLMDQLLNEIG